MFLILYGEQGQSEKLQLKGSKTNKDPFEKGKKDVFDLSTVNIGDVKKINISHDGDGVGAGWFPESISIKNLSNNKTYE